MSTTRSRAVLQNIALLVGSLLFCLAAIEIGYRILDPFPFFSPSEVNHTEHGNLSMYDQTLGWKGVPGGKAELVTENNRVRLEHNGQGFRDIEHRDSDPGKPAIVFLGDSFTWGYEVEFDDMFVNRLRRLLPGREIFNLAHRGYGTDQELLTFSLWRDGRPLERVVLMFSENDVDDNNADMRYSKPKPKYRLVDGELLLTNVPVPRIDDWTRDSGVDHAPDSWRAKLERVLFHSYFIHDLHFRYTLYRRSNQGSGRQTAAPTADLAASSRILDELKKEVERRGARLTVFFIPSNREIAKLDDSVPYQAAIGELCRARGIDCHDLAPYLKSAWLRTYYRWGGHWNARGHKVAAEAIFQYLTRDGASNPTAR